MGFLIGDIDSSRSITASDISAVKAATGDTTDGTNFALDLNTSGKINAADVLAVKSRNGLTLALAAAPTISNTGPFTTTVGSNYFSEFLDSQAPIASAWSVSSGALPQWVTLNPVTGYFSGKPRLSDVGTSNFTVSLTNPNGSATQAVTLIVTSAPPPTVTQVSPSTSPVPTTIIITGTQFTGVTAVTINGVPATSYTLNSPTQISAGVAATTTTGNVIVTTSGGGASATSAASVFTVGALPAGDYSIDNPPALLPNPSRHPQNNPPMSHGGIVGLGPYLYPANNAYHMDATACSGTPAIVNRWQQNIDYVEYHGLQPQDLFAMGPNDALTYKFTVPNVDIVGGVTYDDNIAAGSHQAPVFMTVSKTPCDFDTSKVYYSGNPNFNACYATNGGAGTINWTTINPGLFDCKLNKGETYYVNVRFQDVVRGVATTTSCAYANCGGMIRVQ